MNIIIATTITYLTLNIIGLIFDLIGFVGIYKTKLARPDKIKESRPYYLSSKIQTADLKNVSEYIVKEVNNTISKIFKSYEDRDDKTLKYFKYVICGVSLQILSIVIYVIQVFYLDEYFSSTQ